VEIYAFPLLFCKGPYNSVVTRFEESDPSSEWTE